jgi:arsenite/tail-anchored protein-transporting ATPase
VRIIVFTGKGGVGKTSVAAATALGIARAGARTLVMSTDPAHSLADSFGTGIDAELTEIAPKLFGQQIDAQQRLEQHWGDIQEFTTQFLSWAGADPVAAEEIMALPGIEEVFSLTDLRRHADEGDFDCIVVDCAPTAETLRLLSLPEIARWYIERIFPIERRVVRVVRPVLERVTSMPIASDKVFQSMQRLHENLDAVGKILTDGTRSTIRIVVNPEKMVIAEARRLFTYLALFGYQVDAVIANRILPDAVSDPYFAKWKKIQATHLDAIRESFAPIPVLTSRLYDEEMVGADLLEELCAEVYGDSDPSAIFHSGEPMVVRSVGGAMVLELQLPYADGRLDLSRRDDDLIVTVGSYRRSILLPQSLRRREVVDASFDGPALLVTFKGDDDERRSR